MQSFCPQQQISGGGKKTSILKALIIVFLCAAGTPIELVRKNNQEEKKKKIVTYILVVANKLLEFLVVIRHTNVCSFIISISSKLNTIENKIGRKKIPFRSITYTSTPLSAAFKSTLNRSDSIFWWCGRFK